MKGTTLSRIYFNTRTRTAEVHGSERGWLRYVAANTASLWWGLHELDAFNRAVEIANMIVPGSCGQYVRDRANQIGHVPARATITPHDRHRHVFIDIVHTCLRVNNVPLQVGDHVVFSADVELNTSLAIGNDMVRLAAKIHGWCETHAWVEEDSRAWLADIIERAVTSGVYRKGIWHTGTTGDTAQQTTVRQGWADVVTLLRDTTNHPGPVVLSCSVGDDFPNPEVSTSMPPWPAGVPERWDALTEEQQAERRTARNAWYGLDPDQRWETAMAGIRSSQPWANITPENLATRTFGPSVTLFDLFREDRAKRVKVAFERDAEAEARERQALT